MFLPIIPILFILFLNQSNAYFKITIFRLFSVIRLQCENLLSATIYFLIFPAFVTSVLSDLK